MKGLQHMVALHHFQELRRRMTRTATRALLRGERAQSQSIENVPGTEIRRVLICRPNHRLGNLLLLTPLIHEIERVFPAAEIDIVLAGEQGAELFRTFHNVRHIHTLSRRMIRHPLETVLIAARIRRAKYDLAIDPCEGSQSGRWLMTIANATHVIASPGNALDMDGQRAADVDAAPRHMAKRPVYLLRRALAPSGILPKADYPALDIRLSPTERRRGQQILDVLTRAGSSTPKVIGIFADARGTKRYAEAWWIRFIESLGTRIPGFRVVEIAPPDGRSRLASRFRKFSSPDIREVAAVISRMTCFVSADCGVMHLGCASGTPTIGLFSVTDVAQYAPYGNGSCAIDTNGKSPEQVAQLAATAIAAVQAKNIPSAPSHATHQPPAAGPPSGAGSTQTAGPSIED